MVPEGGPGMVPEAVPGVGPRVTVKDAPLGVVRVVVLLEPLPSLLLV